MFLLFCPTSVYIYIYIYIYTWCVQKVSILKLDRSEGLVKLFWWSPLGVHTYSCEFSVSRSTFETIVSIWWIIVFILPSSISSYQTITSSRNKKMLQGAWSDEYRDCCTCKSLCFIKNCQDIILKMTADTNVSRIGLELYVQQLRHLEILSLWLKTNAYVKHGLLLTDQRLSYLSA